MNSDKDKYKDIECNNEIQEEESQTDEEFWQWMDDNLAGIRDSLNRAMK